MTTTIPLDHADMAARLDAEHAPAWRPNPGDKLIGNVAAIDEHDAGSGPYPVLTLRADGDELLAVHAFHRVLRSELAKIAPQVGDWIGIKYLGERDGDQRRYHGYRVVSARAPSQVDWARYRDPEPAVSDVPAPAAPVSTAADDDIPF